MKKFMAIAMATLFLAASAGWAQTTQTKRKHTRPPYSGPRKEGTGHKKPRTAFDSSKHKTGDSKLKAKPGHIIVR